MKKIILIGVLLLTGNIGFSEERQDGNLKCQKLVSDVFGQYNLNSLLKNVDLTEKKPKFSETTEPMHIPQKKVVDPWEIPFVVKKVKLIFKGRILKNGSYEFKIEEHTKIIPDSVMIYLKDNGYKDSQEFQLLTHTFQFSNECKFQKYHIRQNPYFIPYYHALDRGFYVSADSKCNFDEPVQKGKGYIDSLTARSIWNLGGISYRTLNHPHYYRGLCALAKK